MPGTITARVSTGSELIGPYLEVQSCRCTGRVLTPSEPQELLLIWTKSGTMMPTEHTKQAIRSYKVKNCRHMLSVDVFEFAEASKDVASAQQVWKRAGLKNRGSEKWRPEIRYKSHTWCFLIDFRGEQQLEAFQALVRDRDGFRKADNIDNIWRQKRKWLNYFKYTRLAYSTYIHSRQQWHLPHRLQQWQLPHHRGTGNHFTASFKTTHSVPVL